MKFIIGESSWSYLDRLTYRGVIGLFYDDTLSGLLSYVIVGLIAILAVIGLIAICKGFFSKKKKNKDPYKEWIRTGKM